MNNSYFFNNSTLFVCVFVENNVYFLSLSALLSGYLLLYILYHLHILYISFPMLTSFYTIWRLFIRFYILFNSYLIQYIFHLPVYGSIMTFTCFPSLQAVKYKKCLYTFPYVYKHFLFTHVVKLCLLCLHLVC